MLHTHSLIQLTLVSTWSLQMIDGWSPYFRKDTLPSTLYCGCIIIMLAVLVTLALQSNSDTADKKILAR